MVDFNKVSFMNENHNVNSYKKTDINVNAINENGSLIRNCNVFLSDSLFSECNYDPTLIERAAILEGAKLDLKLQNWLKEGEDYKSLKKDVREIVKANNLDDSELKSGKDGFMHTCKRILQCLEDILILTSGISAGTGVAAGITATVVSGNPVFLLTSVLPNILGFVIGFIINRLERLLWDTIEFNTIKKDAETIVSDLRATAKKCENKKMAEKFNSEADRLEKSIEKYSKKRKEKEKKED